MLAGTCVGGAGITVSGTSGSAYYIPGFTSLTNTAGTSGIVSFGGGGGGGGWSGACSGAGGSGVALISYFPPVPLGEFACLEVDCDG